MSNTDAKHHANKVVGNNINAIRVHYGLSQEAFAEAISTSQTAVSFWERGDGLPSKASVDKILDVFKELSSDDIFSEINGFARRVLSPDAESAVPVPFLNPIPTTIVTSNSDLDGCDVRYAPAKFVRNDPNCFFIPVKGDSMNRHIPDGHIALISPKYADAKVGEYTHHDFDIFLVAVGDDEPKLMHTRRLSNGIELFAGSFDITYQTRIFDFNNPNTPKVRVLGKAVWSCMDY